MIEKRANQQDHRSYALDHRRSLARACQTPADRSVIAGRLTASLTAVAMERAHTRLADEIRPKFSEMRVENRYKFMHKLIFS